ncbi:hypothetical protein EV182_003942, partial [Spiromyces aspiralis]
MFLASLKLGSDVDLSDIDRAFSNMWRIRASESGFEAVAETMAEAIASIFRMLDNEFGIQFEGDTDGGFNK